MRAERRVVDTNVLISGLLQPSGRTAEILSAIRAVGGLLIFSNETFAELASRLMRPKFDRYVERGTRQRFLSELASVAEWVAITGVIHACRDPDDDKFLETAINGQADCIVTGDADLLTLDPFSGAAAAVEGDSTSTIRRGSAKNCRPSVRRR